MQDPEKLKVKKIDSLGAGCGEILMLLKRRSNWTKIMGSWRGVLKIMKWIMYGRNGFEHMAVMLSVGATITDFSIFAAHVSGDGGDYTSLSKMCEYANGALFPLIISYIYTLLYQKDSTKSLYRIFSYMVTLVPVASMFAWVIIPFAYLQGNAPVNDDVTKFLNVFCKNYHPLIVSAMAVVLIGIGVVLMIKKQVIHNFIKEIKQATVKI